MKQTIIFGLLLYQLTLVAQEQQTFRVKASADLKYALPVQERYRYPQFKDGMVTFLNGTTANAKLNYNFLLGEVQFIGPARDTLSLANEQTIKQIKIAEQSFYYDVTNGYVESVMDTKLAQLVVKTMFRVGAVEKMAGMGKSSATSSIKEYNMLATGNSSVQRLSSQGDVVLSKSKTYFLMDANRRFYRIAKSSFFKIYSAHKKTIEAYLDEQKIDFQQGEDLKKLLKFCGELE